VNPFAYAASDAFVNGMDVRYKLFCLSFMGIATLQGGPVVLVLNTAIVLGLAVTLRIRPIPFLAQLKPFFFLLALVFASQSVTTPGQPAIEIWGITATRQGMAAGALVSWRFLLVMVLGILFSKSTKPSQVKGAVQWFLRPLPLVPQARVAVMVSLFLRFLPQIAKQASEVSQAQQARCAALQKNPFKRMLNLSIPLLRKTFQSADQVAVAMAARCYTDDRTDPVFCCSDYDKKALGVCLFILGLSFLA
jgi:energy-coupling factor transporter transmembrane protein EcfT